MNTFAFVLFLAAMDASAQPALAPPQLGFIAASDRSLRLVTGVAGSPVLGPAAEFDLVSVAWSGSWGLVKSGDALLAFDGVRSFAAIEAPPGPALFAFHSDGSPALALLPGSGSLYSWTGASFKPISFRADLLAGTPIAIALPQFDRVSAIVRRDNGLWLVEESRRGAIELQTLLPGVKAPLLLQNDGGLIYADRTALVVRDRDGHERRVELGMAVTEMHAMGPGWVEVIAADSGWQYAVRVAAGRECVSQLPEVQP